MPNQAHKDGEINNDSDIDGFFANKDMVDGIPPRLCSVRHGTEHFREDFIPSFQTTSDQGHVVNFKDEAVLLAIVLNSHKG